MLRRKWLCSSLASLALIACSGVPAGRPPPPSGSAPAGAPASRPQGGVVYRIDPAGSELRLLVYRSGALAQLGHNHVIEDRALAGWVAVAEPLRDSSIQLQFAAAELIVDDPGARRQEGADFAEDVSADAIAGTRSNMLGAGLLDADRYPEIRVQSVAIDGAADAPTARLKIQIAGREAEVSAPFTYQRSGALLSISADFPLPQSALGLTPFSVMFGALRVDDVIRVKLRIKAGQT